MDPVIVKIKELNPEIIAPTSDKMNEPEYGGSKIVVIGKPGCFTAGTQILMYNGNSKNVEDIKVNDVIMGDDSTPRTVLELCYNEDEMFQVIPNDNFSSYTVNKQHKLVLKTHLDFDEYKVGEIYEMTIEEYLKQNDLFKTLMCIYRSSVEFPTVNVELENLKINLSCHIPNKYKINSKKNRTIFVREIIDSLILSNTVYYDNIYNCLTCCFNSEDFSEDFIFICKSLGLLVKKIICKDNIFICQIYGDLNSLGFKKFILENHQNNYDLSTSFKIVPKGTGKYYGFTLNGNHRFLLSSFDVVRNTGKSTLIASLLYAKKHIFPVAIAFSGTEDSNGFFRKLMPSTFVFNEYSPDKIENFIKRQKIAKRHIENPWAIIIIDDCTDDPRVLATPLQQGIYKRGRHWKCLYILSLQYSMDVKPVIRTNVDGVFILRDPSLKNRKSLWENYASIVPDFNMFCQIMDQLTDNFTALYIHNQTRTNNWQDCVFYYKAPLTPEGFKFGAPEYWEFHEERFDKNYQDPFDTV